MEIFSVDVSYVLGACIGITQKHGLITEDKFLLVSNELLELEKGFIAAELGGAADSVSKFRAGWKNGFPKNWASS